MNEYYLRATGPDGSRNTERVEAEDPAAAIRKLRESGYHDIELLTDEIGASFSASVAKRRGKPHDGEAAALMGHTSASALRYALRKHRTVALIGLVAAMVAVGRRVIAEPWTTSDWVLIVCAGLCGFVFAGYAYAPHAPPVRRYRRLLAAYAWQRWDEMDRLSDALGGPEGPMGDDLAFRRAVMKAAQGDLKAALFLVDVVETEGGMPPWMVCARRAELYSTVGDYPQAIACAEEALALRPAHASAHADLARLHLMYGDPEAARPLVAKTPFLPATPRMRYAFEWNEGMLALVDDEPRAALRHLARADEAAREHIPDEGRIALDALLASYRCEAHAALGDVGAAAAAFADAKPFLELWNVRPRLEACRKALAAAADD